MFGDIWCSSNLGTHKIEYERWGNQENVIRFYILIRLFCGFSVYCGRIVTWSHCVREQNWAHMHMQHPIYMSQAQTPKGSPIYVPEWIITRQNRTNVLLNSLCTVLGSFTHSWTLSIQYRAVSRTLELYTLLGAVSCTLHLPLYSSRVLRSHTWIFVFLGTRK